MCVATGAGHTTKTDLAGNYEVPTLQIGNYDVTVDSSGMQKEVAKGLVLAVGRTTVQNFQLKVISQSHHGIDPRRSTRRDETCEQCDRD